MTSGDESSFHVKIFDERVTPRVVITDAHLADDRSLMHVSHDSLLYSYAPITTPVMTDVTLGIDPKS